MHVTSVRGVLKGLDEEIIHRFDRLFKDSEEGQQMRILEILPNRKYPDRKLDTALLFFIFSATG